MSREREQEVTRSVSDAPAAEAQPPTESKRPWQKPGFEVVDYSITQTSGRNRGSDLQVYS